MIKYESVFLQGREAEVISGPGVDIVSSDEYELAQDKPGREPGLARMMEVKARII